MSSPRHSPRDTEAGLVRRYDQTYWMMRIHDRFYTDGAWAAQDRQGHASTRQKDFADIARLIEAEPALRAHVPQDVLARLV